MGISWFPGQLLPYESVVSFVSRFCQLNGVSPSRCLQYFRFDNREIDRLPLSLPHMLRIAEQLGEPLEIVKTVFAPPLQSNHLGVHENTDSRDSGLSFTGISWCARCLQKGFHSSLHQENWIVRCPMHSTDLDGRDNVNGPAMGTIRAVKRFSNEVTKACPMWPHVDVAESAVFTEIARALHAWALLAAFKLRSLLGDFRDSDARLSRLSVISMIERFDAVHPLPAEFCEIVVGHAPVALVEVRVLAVKFAAAVDQALATYSWRSLFRIFHSSFVYSGTKSSWSEQLRAGQDLLRRGHTHGEKFAMCNCKWQYARSPNYGRGRWQKRVGEWWLGVQQVCPVEHAIELLEEEFGNFELFLTRHQRLGQREDYLEEVKNLQRQGYIKRSEAWQFKEPVDPQLQRAGSFQWAAPQALTVTLEAWCGAMITDRVKNLAKWLLELEQGSSPHRHSTLSDAVQLCRIEERYLIVRWDSSEA